MNWGRMIFATFIVFGALIITLVTISMKQDIDLVSENYYEQEIKYQGRIEQMQNVALLEVQPTIEVTDNKLLLKFADNSFDNFEVGTLVLFSPVSKAEDKMYHLDKTVYPSFQIDTKKLRKGNWKVIVEWKDKNKEYYIKTNITL